MRPFINMSASGFWPFIRCFINIIKKLEFIINKYNKNLKYWWYNRLGNWWRKKKWYNINKNKKINEKQLIGIRLIIN